MTIRPVTYYQVVCDYPGCEHSTEDDGSDFTAYGDSDQAVENWGYGENQIIEVFVPLDPTVTVTTFDHGGFLTIHLCDEHRVVTEGD